MVNFNTDIHDTVKRNVKITIAAFVAYAVVGVLLFVEITSEIFAYTTGDPLALSTVLGGAIAVVSGAILTVILLKIGAFIVLVFVGLFYVLFG